jgi:hypothetical protein
VVEQAVDLEMSLLQAAHSVNEPQRVLLGDMPATYSYKEYTDLAFVYGFAMGMDVLL